VSSETNISKSAATARGDNALDEMRPESAGFVLLLLGSLYFAQGLPLGYAFAAYPTILRDAGADLSLLAWIPLAGLPWVLKFLWAPFVDNHWWPRVGRRRSWLLSQQLVMIAIFVAISMSGLQTSELPLVIGLFVVASLSSATQDIASDGLAAELLRGPFLTRANAISVGAMAAGTLTGGGGVLITIQWLGFQGATLALAAILALCAIPSLIWKEPPSSSRHVQHRASLRVPFRRRHFWPLLAIAAFYCTAHSADGALVRLYLVDKGWTLPHVGTIDTIGMAAMIAITCGFASWIVARLMIARSLVAGILLMLVSSCAWLLCAWYNAAPSFAFAAIFQIIDNIGMGIASVAAFTAFMQFAGQGDQTGTDVAIFKSGNVLGEIGAASAATAIAASSGYGAGFAFGTLLSGAVVLACMAARPLFSRSGSKTSGEHDEGSLPAGNC